ncbi:MAG TPA: glycosyltransferase family 39 protein [Longimicrobiales bacterium]
MPPQSETGAQPRPLFRLLAIPLTIDFMLLALLFAAAASAILLTFRDYGISFDEQWHEIYGEYVIGWYTSLFRDRRATEYWTFKYYGGLFDMLANSVARFLPFDRFESRHLCNALFALIGVTAVCRMGKYLQGRRAGIMAALFLLLIPRWYGHGFNNPKDIPFAALFAFGMYYLIRAVRAQPRPEWRVVLKFAVAAGLCTGVRVGGIILVFFWGLIATLWAAEQIIRRRRDWWWAFVRAAGVRLAVIVVMAYSIMLLVWPAAQLDPLRFPLEAFRAFGHLPVGPVREFFEGGYVSTTDLPWYYLPKWLLITLPEFVLVGLLFGCGLLIFRWQDIQASNRMREYGLLALAALFPIVYAIVTNAKLYDGMRHFLFIVPTIAVLAAVSWVGLIELSGKLHWVVQGALAIALVTTLHDMVELHPYQYVYFNRGIAGGLQNAARSYNTDYWGDSYREGALWVSAHYDPRPGQRIRVTSCSYPFSTSHFLPKDRFAYVNLGRGAADLFLATTRNDCQNTLAGRVVHIVKREDTPLLYIKELTPL